MRNTWWVTRPKRNLISVPRCLTALATVAEGRIWTTRDKSRELEFESMLEISGLKAVGNRRDQGGGGARTYRAWMKSLGLLFMDKNGTLRLTVAGEALTNGSDPLPILRDQVLKYQFPSAFTNGGNSGVDSRFRVRPFILILQLLRDRRLGGYLREKQEIAQIVLCYGESNSQATVDDLVGRILRVRSGDLSHLNQEYLKKFASSRSQERSLEKLCANLADIANTMANWLGYTQLIQYEDGTWCISEGLSSYIDELLGAYVDLPLIPYPEDEERFQRSYGLTPGKKKDTRSFTTTGQVTSRVIAEDQVKLAWMNICSNRIVTKVSSKEISEVSARTGVDLITTERILSKYYPTGSAGLFMHEFAQKAFKSREEATSFEIATAEIFKEIFGFKAEHIGNIGRRPDVVVVSEEFEYGAILDAKAYSKGYSLRIGQRDRMRDYIENYNEYALSKDSLAFFAYVVSDYKDTMDAQILEVFLQNGVPGAAVTARDLIRLVEVHQDSPLTHGDFRSLFTLNRAITWKDIELLAKRSN